MYIYRERDIYITFYRRWRTEDTHTHTHTWLKLISAQTPMEIRLDGG